MFLLAGFAFSNESDFEQCFQKNSQSMYIISDVLCIATSENELLCHDPLKKITNFPKEYELKNYDPFVRLFKIKSKKKLKPVKFKKVSDLNEKRELALISKSDFVLGRIIDFQNGFDGFGKFSQKDTNKKIIGSKCYTVVGIGSGNFGFVSTEYLQGFLAKTNSVYSDIGIRLKEAKGKIYVDRVDVFFPLNLFQENDEILSIDSVSTPRIDLFSNKILFSERNKNLKVKIKREGKEKIFDVKTGIRYGGGFISDTFLERFGIFFDNDLTITEIKKDSYAYKAGLRAGDRIIKVDRQDILNMKELIETISKKSNIDSLILLERDDFQFFFTIK